VRPAVDGAAWTAVATHLSKQRKKKYHQVVTALAAATTSGFKRVLTARLVMSAHTSAFNGLSARLDTLSERELGELQLHIISAYVVGQSEVGDIAVPGPRAVEPMAIVAPERPGMMRYLTSAEAGEEVLQWITAVALGSTDCTIVFATFTLAVSALGDPSKPLSVILNYIWIILSAFGSTRKKEVRESVYTAIRAHITKFYQSPPGTTAPPPQPEDVEWALCILYLTLSKDLRVFEPDNMECRLPARIANLELVAEAAVNLRPAVPYSHFQHSFVLLDTHEMIPVSQRDQQLSRAYNAAVHLLATATDADDAMYMSIGHSCMAYWKLTSSHPPPYTLGEIQRHLADAASENTRARVYADKQELHRGTAMSQDIVGALNAAISAGFPQGDVPIWEAFLLSDHESTSGHSGRRDVSVENKYSCVTCNRVITRKLRCSRCKKVAYCSEACQKRHWKVHKKDCK
jgi:hypothetical protein